MGVRLTRLTVVGFKSFADPVELVFDRGITAIVGPNGSGKSNLADAIAWVLGEQSGTVMRSRRAEDVIFAGGPGRAGLGMAEVTLVLEQDEEELGLPFREVTLTRRVFRDGDTQYAINGARARLRDVLQIAAALRAEWVIVRQGAVEELLALRPSERRDVLEHAAGLSGLRLRQAEARQQLAEAERHAQRLADLLQELEPHVQSLAEAAERARQALAVREALRESTLLLFAARWRRAREEVDRVRLRLAELDREDGDAKQVLRSARESLQRTEQEHQALLAERETCSVRRHERARAAEAAAHRAQLADQRAATLGAHLHLLEEDTHRAYEEVEAATAELERLESSWAAACAELAEVESALQRVEEAAAIRAQQADRLRSALQVCERQLRRYEAECQQLARERTAVAAAVETQRRERARLQAQRAARAQERATFEEELAALEARGAELEKRLASATAEVERQSTTVRRHAATVQRSQQTVDELERELVFVRTRLQVLSQALEGELVSSATRAVLAAARRGLLHGVVGALGTLIETPPELETALEAALGGHVHDVVVERWSDAEAAIAYLKEHRAGRATFHPLDSVRTLLPARLPLGSGAPGVVGIAADLVSTSPALRPIVQSLLGRVLVVTDLAVARRLLAQLPAGWIIVTREGEIVRLSGSVTGGATRGRERGILTQAREHRALADRCARLQELVTQARRELADAQARHEQARIAEQEARRTLQLLESERTELLAARARAQRALAALAEAEQHDAEASMQLEQLLASNVERERSLVEQAAASEAIRTRLEEQRSRLVAELAAFEAPDAERDRLSARAAVIRERLRSLERERAQLQRQLQGLERRLQEFAARRENLMSERDTALVEASRAAEEAARLRAEVVELEQEETRLAVLVEERARQLASARSALSAAEERLRRVERELASTRATLERSEQVQRSVLESAVWELDGAWQADELAGELDRLALQHREPVERLERRLADLRRQWQELRQFGEATIAQYEAERTRYESLRSELQDVRATIQTLRTLLSELDQQIERGFVRSLRALDRAFAAACTELFGGGRARLIARDGTGSIEGVELVVQPAGKRVRSVQQLSGGERTLAAVALRVALLEVNPLPFCVLDEVDAALDEANVLRFRSVLERLAERTQFLVITHNRATIEAAGTLYGVTMGADGVSRVVSLRLADYVEE
ncbi:MAG: chromosome segregation protein SMC [Thermomicrobium sp.]|nr:chromosome segregation protein SMC [Thermomicrobium sp.]